MRATGIWSIMIAASASAVTHAAAQPAPKEVQASPHTTAIFAGGCFWCAESDFEHLAGVTEVVSGYTGGRVADPTYEQVSEGGTGHVEAVRVTYDPKRISYAQLVDYFFRHIDPTDGGGQFCDRGNQYRSAIFVATPEQARIAERAKAKLDASATLPGPIATLVLPASAFYPAEGYHQDYYKKNPIKYRFYRFNCGRDARINSVWKKERQAERRGKPTPPTHAER